MLTVVLLAAMGGAEVQVKSHVEGALKVGNTKEEIACGNPCKMKKIFSVLVAYFSWSGNTQQMAQIIAQKTA